MAARVVRRLVCSLAIALAACGEVPSTPTDAGIDSPPPIDAIDAIDAPSTATLTVTNAGAPGGLVTSAPAGIDCGATCTLTVPVGTSVVLTATAPAGVTFGAWSGGCTGTGPTCTLTVGGDTTVTATFAVAMYPVTVNLMGNGTGSVTSTPGGITCPGTCTTMVAHGSTLALAAAPGAGSTFGGWGGSCVGTGACNLTVTAPTTVSATFALNNSLVVMRAGNGNGTVTSAPAGINCGSDCTEAYPNGTIVTLTASAAAGSTFTGWAGGGCTGTGVCTITLNAGQTVTATFTLNQYTLTVARAGTGSGTVTSSPAGINCGTDCTEVYNHGTAVTLTAAPTGTSTFTGWSGGGCSGTGTCTVTLTAATTVTATFALAQQTLTVAKAGGGVGTVTSSPAGINCGTDCTESYNMGQTVVLTVTPGAGSNFAGWSGGGCTGLASSCTVTMNAATTVTATFDLVLVVVDANWNCAIGANCADLYDFTFQAETDVRVDVVNVTGSSVVRLNAHAPGVPFGSTSLLTGIASDRMCVGQNLADGVSFRAIAPGAYRIVVARDWGSSGGATGTYSLRVSTNRGMTYNGTNNNDIPNNVGTRCGYIATFSSGWNCASGVSCQDVYDFEVVGSTTATVSATAITGSSVVRQAVFAGSSLSGINRLNGGSSDRRCAGQNASDTATTSTMPSGLLRFAIGRDWGASAGASGTYTYTITTPSAPLAPRGQTVNDGASLFAASTCP